MFCESPALHVTEQARKKLLNGNRLTTLDFAEAERMAEDGMLQTAGTEEKKFRVYDAAGTFFGVYGWDDQRKDFKSMKMFFD